MTNPIVIKKGMKLGELDAEGDTQLLLDCFVDNGDLSTLLDVDSPAGIIVGRTGAGKSALVIKIHNDNQANSVLLDPSDISLSFLEHSNILQFLDSIGVRLDLFFKLLWRHILVVELLKLRYGFTSADESKNFISSIRSHFQNNEAKKKALEYFIEWGDKFWLEVDEQLKEIVEKLESDVRAALGAGLSNVKITLEGSKKLTTEQRSEVKSRAEQVVSEIQIRKLNELIKLLGEYAFEDRQKKYYILIDKLDEDWADTELRCRFIRALIEEIKYFRNLNQVKIIPALRLDLLNLVFDKTRDSGFQQEKYESLILPIKWDEKSLTEIVDSRLNEVFRRQYTSSKVFFSEVFPSQKESEGHNSMQYILQRTLMRPRDVLQFFNECLMAASDRERVSWRAIRAAESAYSAKRLKSLVEEWYEIYPYLEETLETIRGLRYPFNRSDIDGERLATLAASVLVETYDPNINAVKDLCSPEGTISEADARSMIIQTMYRIGAIGVKVSSLDTTMWSFVDQPEVTPTQVKRVEKVYVHKMLHHALEIRLTDKWS